MIDALAHAAMDSTFLDMEINALGDVSHMNTSHSLEISVSAPADTENTFQHMGRIALDHVHQAPTPPIIRMNV